MVLAIAEQQLWRETPYYYDTLNPVQTPWHPPSEKNIEEVFKRHEYFAVVYSDAGRQLVVSRSLYLEHCASCHGVHRPGGAGSDIGAC